MKINLILKKIGYKENAICFDNSAGSKIVLILWKQIIKLYIKPTIIDIKELDFVFILK